MQNSQPSTIEILALRGLGRIVDARSVDWAVSMLVAGHDTPSLRVLAGESSPFNQFEMVPLVDRTIDELGLRQYASPDEAAVGYAAVMARRLLEGVTPVDVALREIADVCVEQDYLKAIYDFYLLRFAREDLQKYGDQHWWEGATRGNIDEVIMSYCRRWLGDRKSDV